MERLPSTQGLLVSNSIHWFTWIFSPLILRQASAKPTHCGIAVSRKLIQSKFYGAAVSIQSKFRGYRARKHVKMLRRLVAIQKRQALAAKRIQNRVRLA